MGRHDCCAAIEAALAAAEKEVETPSANKIDGIVRPPTPASWSDTKHSEDGEALAEVVFKEAMNEKGMCVCR